MRGKVLIASGAVVLVVSVVFFGAAIASVVRMVTIVPDEAHYVVHTPGADTLKEGEYQLWIEFEEVTNRDQREFLRQWQEVEIKVLDGKGEPLEIEDSNEQDNFGKHCPYGIVSVPADGEYHFEADSARTVYVTEPMDAMDLTKQLAWCFLLGILAGGVGLVLTAVGVAVAIAGRVRTTEPAPQLEESAPHS